MDLKQQTLRQILDNQAVGFQARFDSFDMDTITDDQRKVRKNAQAELTKIKKVKENLSKSSVNILDKTMYELNETPQGRAALLKVFTDSKIKTLKNGSEVKGPMQNIIAKLKQSFNDAGYKEQFFNAKNPTSNKTAIGVAFTENPDKKINATILKRLTVLGDFYKKIKAQVKVTAYPDDFHVKMTGALKDLKGDFKTALGMQMYGGFRPGDLAGVDISQIDLERGVIHNVVLKSGGGTTVKDLIIGDAEKAILQNSIKGRTSGPLYTIPQAQIDKVVNQKIVDTFPDKINVRVEGVEGTKQLTQKYLRKSFTDLMAEMGHSIEDMEVKSGRADMRVIEGYMSDPVKMRRIQNIASDVAKSISGYTGHVSVGNGLASWGFNENYVNKYAGSLPVTAYNMPSPQFTTYANQTFPQTYNTIQAREPVNSFYSKPESKNNYIAPSGDSTEASKVAAMQNSIVQTNANQAYANLRVSTAGSLGIKPEDMNVGDNEQLIDAEIEKNENKLKSPPKKKIDKPVKEATPVANTKRAKVFQSVANLLGVDLGTDEGLQKVMQHIRNAKKTGGPLLSVGAGFALPAISLFTDTEAYSSPIEKAKTVAADTALSFTALPLTAVDFGLGTEEQQKKYKEQKEEYIGGIDEKTAQQQRRRDALRVMDTETNLMLDMQNNINNNQQ